MSTAKAITIVGVFSNRPDADAAINALYQAGFNASEIGVASRNGDGTVGTKTDSPTKVETEAEDAGEGALAGAAVGVGIGGLIGAGVIAGIIPVIGPALFGGTLAGILASNAAAGAAATGIVGALIGWGVPEEHATYYESEVAAGRTIVTVTSSGRSEEARTILKTYGGASRT